MANQHKGEVEVKVGGKLYALRPTFEALQQIESELGVGIIELASRVKFHNALMTEIVKIIRITANAGMGEDDERLTDEGVGECVVGEGIYKYVVPVADFLLLSLQGRETLEDDAGNAPAAESES